jgi:uncharacterized membrane protein YheB (UPF0754 family)
MPEELLRPLLTIAFGALAGGLTNSVAIWMLFHPYEPPTFMGRRMKLIQGAVPKNQDRLATAIGRTVGNRLLTPEDLTSTFAKPEFRETFDERLALFLDGALHTERGSLRSLLPAQVLPQVESILKGTADHAIARLDEYLDSEEFEAWLKSRAGDLLESIQDHPVGEILTPAREAAVADAVEDCLEKAIQGYLPLAIQRLGRLLEDPQAREKFEATIHDLLQRFLKDLRFHQRVVARLVMTEDTVEKVLNTVEEEGAERISEMLRDPAVQDAMSKGINDAVVDFLRRPVVSVLGSADDENVVNARTTLTDWVMGLVRDPGTREFLVEKLYRTMDRASEKTWGELLDKVPADRVAGILASAARSEPARSLYRDGAENLLDALLDRPLGRPSEWLPDGAPAAIENSLSDPVWDWLQGQVPGVVERIDVARRVEEKVQSFPTARMEELVRKVTHRELKLIVRLGYVLGGVIGAALVGLNAILGP